ncbi:MAG: chemotaxis protein CheW [Spirochaetales bacterium]|nr:chemotaxis protein CheW [Spirochaetales bacterium]
MGGKERIEELLKSAGRNKGAKSAATGITKEFLIVGVGGALLGLHIEYLREVFDLPDRGDVIPLPFVPAHLLGVINVRGEIVPVLALSDILGLGETPEGSLKMVVIDEKFKAAFPVREIIDLKAIDVKELRSVKDPTRKSEDHMLTQEFSYEGKTVGVIDVLKLYSSRFLA